jgi:uncharacterized membrane protein
MSYAFAAALPAFLASLVEFVEALTIVLAVGVTRGWSSALWGSAAAAAALAALVAIFGPALAHVPLAGLQLAVGILLLFFGLRWLRKALLRYAGTIALHDESAIYERRRRALSTTAQPAAGIDGLGFAAAFQAVALEGLEVVFIVIAVGAGARAYLAASAGALLAGIAVVGAGVALRAPLSRIPENALKLCVGILLSGFGTFWTGEGLRIAWPGAELSLLWLVGGFAIAASLAYLTATRTRRIRAST